MTEPFHLTAEVVERIQREAIERFGGTPGLRSRELLESALGGAQASFGGRSVFEDEVEIAAA